MIAVTGASGLLGRFLIERLAADGEKVAAITRKKNQADPSHASKNIIWREADVTDPVALEAALQGATTVIHAAAFVSFNPRAKNKIFDTNVLGTKTLIDACLNMGVQKVVHVSSVAALGRKKGAETIDENTPWVESPLNSDYAKSKYLAELEIFRGVEEGLSASIVNPSFILAPVDWEKSSAQVFQFVWKENLFFPSGYANYVDVLDVVEIIVRLLSENYSGQRFIASAGSILYQQLFVEMARRLQKRPPPYPLPDGLLPLFARLEEARSWLLGTEPLISRESIKAARAKSIYSNAKSIEKLNFRYRSLEETLNRCCDFFMQTYTTKKS